MTRWRGWRSCTSRTRRPRRSRRRAVAGIAQRSAAGPTSSLRAGAGRHAVLGDLYEDRVFRVHDLDDRRLGVLGYELVCVEVAHASLVADPADGGLERDAGGVLEGASGSNEHDVIPVL